MTKKRISICVLIGALMLGLIMVIVGLFIDENENVVQKYPQENFKIELKANLIKDEYSLIDEEGNEYNQYFADRQCVYLKEYERYYITVFSKDKFDSVYIPCDGRYYNNNYIAIYAINKKNGLATKFDNFEFEGSFNVDSIEFVYENKFIIEMVDKFTNKLNHIREYYIIEDADDIANGYWAVCYSDGSELKYEITDKYFVSFDGELTVNEFEVKYDYTTNKWGINSHGSHSVRNDITTRYAREVYFNQGYFKKVDGNIYYLSNDLTIKNLETGETIDTIASVEEFFE